MSEFHSFRDSSGVPIEVRDVPEADITSYSAACQHERRWSDIAKSFITGDLGRIVRATV
jgi:hypothetical protein